MAVVSEFVGYEEVASSDSWGECIYQEQQPFLHNLVCAYVCTDKENRFVQCM